ncbi:unnamed protein product [Allacma fusca]|uniref:Cytochrome P450 n=1 Tax=Allacma fusca TaxID=39272 RepID=A0A8J2NTA1_9HEXA|nr:unnamed protein product [Allacma fusca]
MPGPAWPFPFVGHLLLLSNQPYKTFLDWSKIYGPIFCLQLGSLKTVVLNDVQIMKEAFGLMETSGRPPIKAYTQTCDNKGILFTSGPEFQAIPRILKRLGWMSWKMLPWILSFIPQKIISHKH